MDDRAPSPPAISDSRPHDIAGGASSPRKPVEIDRDVFIVHAEDDAPFVHGELLPMLNLGADRVIVSGELPFPAFIEQAIESSVRRSQLTIAVVSPAYLRDRWAGFAELLSRNVNDDGRAGSLVPLLIANCRVPPILAQHATLEARTPAQRKAAATRLRDRLGRAEPQAELIECPYPGMQPFSETTAARFHGRENEIDGVLGRLHAGEREIYVIGPSGSGKSSLIAAGVLPRIQRDPGNTDRFVVRTIRPGEYPVRRLADALGCEPTSLYKAPGELLERERCGRLLVFIDQLEELFALADAEQRDGFIRALRVLRAERRCHVIAALRADFYGALMSSALWSDVEGCFARLEIAPLRGHALRAAIEVPAFDAGVHLEHALVERLMSDTAAEPGALPLLQEALVLLWARRSHRLLRLMSYEELDTAVQHDPSTSGADPWTSRAMRACEPRSGIAVALARRADAALHDLTPAQQRVARRILLRLVSFGEGRPDTRRQQSRSALAACGTEGADADAVIDRLVDARLLTSSGVALRGEPFIDLAHEALIAGWPELQHWLLSRRDDEQRRRLLELHAAQWVQRGRGSVGLFDAIELAEAERWLAGDTACELGYSNDLPQFLAASRDAIAAADRHRQLAIEVQEHERRAAQDERARMRKRLTRFTMVGLTLLVLIGLAAWRQRGEAKRQRQEALRQLARNKLEQARYLVVERRDPVSALPYLVDVASAGIDTAVLRTLLVVTSRGFWTVLVRHRGAVNTAAFSPDGGRVVTASSDGTARVWDSATGNPLGVILSHEQPVRSAAFSPDGTRLVTASEDGTARVWEATTGNPIGVPLKHELPVRSAAFSPDGTRVLTAIEDGTARVWDAATGNPVGVPLKHDKPVVTAVFSPDGARVVTASWDGTARVWDTATGNPLSVPLKHEQTVWSAAFSPNGVRVVTASWDGTARVWDAATGSPVGVPLKHKRSVVSAAFGVDSTRVVTAGSDGTARVWDAATGNPLGVPLKHEKPVVAAAFSSDGARVVTASLDGTARVWDAAAGDLPSVPLKHEKPVMSASFSPDGARVVTASLDSTARVWDAATGNPLGIPLRHETPVVTAAFSPDSARLITATSNGTARVWDAATGNPLGIPLLHKRQVRTAAFSPDGARVVTASDDGTARVWDAVTGSPLGIPLKHKTQVSSAAFSPNSARVVTASRDGTAQVWDAATGNPLGLPLKHEQMLVVVSAAFSPDGERVVTASDDGTARVWDAATGNPLGLPLKHEQPVRTAAFSPDGARVVTASDDGTARVWDAATGNPLDVPLKHEQPVRAAAFSHDGARVVTASEDGTARVYTVTETAGLATFLRAAATCLPQATVLDGAFGVCQLTQRTVTRADLFARARTLAGHGDRALHTQVWSASQARYLQALQVLSPTGNSLVPDDVSALRWSILVRLGMLAAIEGRMAEARQHLAGNAPVADPDLLDMLGSVAHNDLRVDFIAAALLRRAHELDRSSPSVLAKLAEAYFATGQMHEFDRAAAQIDMLEASLEIRATLAALTWGSGKLQHTATADRADRLLRLYDEVPDGKRLSWTWNGTKHAVLYGRQPYKAVEPIIAVLTLLEKPASDDTRTELAALLAAPSRQTQAQ